jgi:hypothetical protein
MHAGNVGKMRRSSHPAKRHPVDEETRLAKAKVAAWIKETRHQPQEVPLEASALISRPLTSADYRQNAESVRASRSVSPPLVLRA